jgi:hypothetical protein
MKELINALENAGYDVYPALLEMREQVIECESVFEVESILDDWGLEQDYALDVIDLILYTEQQIAQACALYCRRDD